MGTYLPRYKQDKIQLFTEARAGKVPILQNLKHSRLSDLFKAFDCNDNKPKLLRHIKDIFILSVQEVLFIFIF